MTPCRKEIAITADRCLLSFRPNQLLNRRSTSYSTLKNLTMTPMARTNRNVVATSVNALDDLNLDEMFEGGDDGIFAGIDLDMNDIGDITGDPSSSSQKKSNKAGNKNKSTAELDAVALDLFSDVGVDDGVTNSPEVATITAKSKRVTKRKTKTPSLDDDDDEFGTQPKKKKKGNKAKSAKPKTKKHKGDTPAPLLPLPVAFPETMTVITVNKASKKRNKSVSIPLPASAPQGSSIVAAAGRFGGLHKRRPFPQLPRATSKNKTMAIGTDILGNITKGKTVAILSPPDEGIIPSPSQKSLSRKVTSQLDPSPWLNPKILDTFCGLKPSATLFYPFIPQMPAEPSMKKCHKHYPMIDKVHSSFASQQATTPHTVNSDDPIFKLLRKEMESHSITTAALGASIAAGRRSILATEKLRLTDDYKAIVALLNRQHGFLYTSLQNMEHWAKVSFSAADYSQIFGPQNGVVMSPSPISKRRKPGGILCSFTSPCVRVKIKCEGFREPKSAPTLLAQLHVAPTSVVVVKTEPARMPKKKKAVTVVDKLSGPKVDPFKSMSFAKMTPSQRRLQIQDALTQRAHQLEIKYIETGESRRKGLEKKQTGLQKVIDEDDLVIINTLALWKWTDKASYFSDITSDDVDDVLLHARQPENDKKDLFWENKSFKTTVKRPTTSLIVSPSKGGEGKGDTVVPVRSLYDRLSLLLVDEGSESDKEASDDSSIDGWDEEESENETEGVIDLSNFSRDERTFIHLRGVGLIDESCPPPANLPAVVIEENSQEKDINDFDALITTIKADLMKLQRVNNKRAAFFETSARAQIEADIKTKEREESNTILIAKYNQLLKRQKECKKTARQRTSKRADEEWMPW